MTEIERLDNPYEKIYQRLDFNKATTDSGEAEKLIQHLGFMYNTFGQAIKDFVKIVSRKFHKQAEVASSTSFKNCIKKANKGSKESQSSQSRENSIDDKPTQNPRQPKSLLILQNPLRNVKKSKKAHAALENPRFNDDSNFELQMQNQNANSKSIIQSKSQGENGDRATTHNFNNVTHFHSLFAKLQSPKKQIQCKPIDIEFGEQLHGHRLGRPKQIIDIDSDNDKSNSLNQSMFNSERVRHAQDPERDVLYQFDEKKVDSCVRMFGGRKKKDREKLKGITCIECEKYYNAMQISGEDMCDCTSRHRSNFPAKKLKQAFTQQFDL